MGQAFRAQDGGGSWLGCNGIAGLMLVAAIAFAGLTAVLVTVFRLVAAIERAAAAARLTDSRGA